MRYQLGERLFRLSRGRVGGRTCGSNFRFTGNFADAKRDIRDRLRSWLLLHLRQERRFEERQLLHPNGISDDQVELFEANLSRPRMGSHGLAHDVAPATLQTEFQQSRFKAEPLGKSGKDAAEGIGSTGAGHAAS
ncbi:MAG TPA: hypothetical protein VLE46_17085 [Nitrospira sp.]|nr:hypothetical protein [Nitrospira sp.]